MNLKDQYIRIENAILTLLAQRDTVSIENLLKDLSMYPESEVRRAVWALLSAHELEVSSDYSLRRNRGSCVIFWN